MSLRWLCSHRQGYLDQLGRRPVSLASLQYLSLRMNAPAFGCRCRLKMPFLFPTTRRTPRRQSDTITCVLTCVHAFAWGCVCVSAHACTRVWVFLCITKAYEFQKMKRCSPPLSECQKRCLRNTSTSAVSLSLLGELCEATVAMVSR